MAQAPQARILGFKASAEDVRAVELLRRRLADETGRTVGVSETIRHAIRAASGTASSPVGEAWSAPVTVDPKAAA